MTTCIFQGIRFYAVGLEDALKIVAEHIPRKNGDYFCLADMHIVVRAQKDSMSKGIMNNAAGVFPDGAGVAFALKILGYKFKGRVRGTDLMLRLCDYASNNGLKIFLYGNTEDTLIKLKKKLTELYTSLNIVGSISPPFRELTPEEDTEIIEKINSSEADILFISLGAPKQEKWMAQHKGKIKPVQLGVGAAFDFITGKVKQAPVWMQKAGLEWLFRLPQQPRKTIYRMFIVIRFILISLMNYVIGKKSWS